MGVNRTISDAAVRRWPDALAEGEPWDSMTSWRE